MAKVPVKRAMVLVVEDDPADQELIRRALSGPDMLTDLQMVGDGAEAMAYLRHEEPYQDPDRFPAPDLVILDLNMPGMSGLEFLEQLRADPDLHHLPVIVMTTSTQDSDVKRAYELNCQAFITKPSEYEDFRETVMSVGQFWFQLVTVPDAERLQGNTSASSPQ